jgi:hypothetical protein
MKTQIIPVTLIVILVLGSIGISAGQTQSKGLYLTYKDYLDHKLSYSESPASPNGNKISINEFLGSGSVTVTGEGKKMSFEKSKLFGYHDSDGSDYRFHDGKSYKITDTMGFFLYTHQTLVQQGKRPAPTLNYYFSKKCNSALFPLTYQNVEIVFPDNAKFQHLVEMASVYNIKPDAYDDGLNKYKIKELYSQSLK